MNNRTVHENVPSTHQNTPSSKLVGQPISIPSLLSLLWISVLFADVLRGVHEILRPGFIAELANEETVYGNEVTDTTLLISGIVLAFICAVVVLARVLPRASNRRVNFVAAAMMIAGVMASWPKDPDDLVFGAFQVTGAVIITVIAARWKDDEPLGGPS